MFSEGICSHSIAKAKCFYTKIGGGQGGFVIDADHLQHFCFKSYVYGRLFIGE